MTELKKAIKDKIAEFESHKTNPSYQSPIEQNAIAVTLRELKYLDSIVEIDSKPELLQLTPNHLKLSVADSEHL